MRSPHGADQDGGRAPGDRRAEPGAGDGDGDGPVKGPGADGGTGTGDRPGTGPGDDVRRRAPDEPTDLPRRSWRAVLRRTVAEFRDDELADRAAALTYYAILSLFPALLLLVSILGLAGHSATDAVLGNVERFAPGSVRQVLGDAVRQIQAGTAGTGSVTAALALVLAVWSASGYIGAFVRAANAVYDVAEGRPVWKLTPLRLGLTVLLVLLASASALVVVFSGGLARRAGEALGAGDTALRIWAVAKWPVLVLLVAAIIAILYWAAPNARDRGLRWVSPGSLVALALWMAASGAFAVYIANFGSYNRTYGTFAGVIVFLVWLWIGNLAILLGLEFDAELSRERAVAGGFPSDEEPYVRPRDTRTWGTPGHRRDTGRRGR